MAATFMNGRYVNGGMEFADIVRLEFIQEHNGEHFWGCFRRENDEWIFEDVVNDETARLLVEHARKYVLQNPA